MLSPLSIGKLLSESSVPSRRDLVIDRSSDPNLDRHAVQVEMPPMPTCPRSLYPRELMRRGDLCYAFCASIAHFLGSFV